MHVRAPRAHAVATLAVLAWGVIAAVAVGADGRVSSRAASVEAAPVLRPSLQQLIAADQPLAYWPLQESAAGPVADVAGSHPGTTQGAVGAGQVGQGPTMTSFGFGRGALVTVPASGLAPGSTGASAWFRTPNRAGASYGFVIDTGALAVGVHRGHAVARVCGDGCVAFPSLTAVTDGAWHQVAISTDAGTATLFLDGRREATAPVPRATAAAAGGVVTIGRQFGGVLDNVAVFDHPLAPAALAAEFGAGACPQAAGRTDTAVDAVAETPALPLHTSGRWIVDRAGSRVKLQGVNWYGADELDRAPAGLQCQTVDAIAARIAAAGFNVVRLPWATDTWSGRALRVPAVAVAANPTLRGKDARQVFDAVVASLARHGLLIVLDNHVGRADWCCSRWDGNALWWGDYDPAHAPRWRTMSAAARMRVFSAAQRRWLTAWQRVSGRYAGSGTQATANVIGVDLRNELRIDGLLRVAPVWRSKRAPVWADWPRAAETAGNLVLRANANLLVMVEGLGYATDLRGAGQRPVRLSVAHRLVYSAHDYAWDHVSPSDVYSDLSKRWGWLLTQHQWFTTPVWVGEFGICHPEQCGDDPWFTAFTQYLRDGDLDWTYWSMNGTSARGVGDPTTCGAQARAPGCSEDFGILDTAWDLPASARLTGSLATLQPTTQWP